MTLPVIIVDTREQLPLEPFIVEKGVRVPLPTVRRKLDVGDYAADGLEHVCAIERKSPADLVGTLFSGGKNAIGEAASNQERFREELLRGRAIPRLYLLVECTFGGLLRHIRDTGRRITPASLMGLVWSLDVNYGVRVIPCDNRDLAAAFVGWTLTYIHEQATDSKAAAKARERGCNNPWLAREVSNG